MEFWGWAAVGAGSKSEETSGLDGTGGNPRFGIFPNFGGTGSEPAGSGVSLGTNGVSVFEHTDNYLPSLLVYNASISGWTHVAVVYSNRQPNLFINGVLVRAGLTSTLSSSPSTILGGRIWSGLNYGFYAGLLDEVSLYNRALSASEIQAIYAAGSSGKCLAPVIVAQPGNQNVFVGDTATFTVGAAGSRPLAYQWNFGGTSIAGATNSSLTLTNVQLSQA